MAKALAPEVKARALTMLAEGDTTTYIADQLGISHQTVMRWRDQAGLQPTGVIPQADQDAMGEMLLVYAKETLDTLIAQARLARSPDWFNAQSAQGIAIWAGTHVDKLTRIMAAFQRLDSEP